MPLFFAIDSRFAASYYNIYKGCRNFRLVISKTCLILRFPGWFLFRDLKPVILGVETSQIIGVSPSLITIKHVLTMVTPSMGYIPITYNQEDVSLHIWISVHNVVFSIFLIFFTKNCRVASRFSNVAVDGQLAIKDAVCWSILLCRDVLEYGKVKCGYVH